MSFALQINVNDKLYLRDPEQTPLGKRIVSSSIVLIDQLGFEEFTFKKLAAEIGSTEASVYRYFENKHRLLIYLVAWYWHWLEYQLNFQLHNLASPQARLNKALEVLADSGKVDPSISHIDESRLHRIVVSEAAKAYLSKNVDELNKEGLYQSMKHFCFRLADVISEAAPQYAYPKALAVSLLQISHQQIFFAQHLPSLTELSQSDNLSRDLVVFLHHHVHSVVLAPAHKS